MIASFPNGEKKYKLSADKAGFCPSNATDGYHGQGLAKPPSEAHEKSLQDESKNIANDTHFNPGRFTGVEGVRLNKALTASNIDKSGLFINQTSERAS